MQELQAEFSGKRDGGGEGEEEEEEKVAIDLQSRQGREES